MKACATDAEFELLQETLVIHHVEGREDVTPFLLVRKKSMHFVKTHNKALQRSLKLNLYSATLTDLANTSVSSMRSTKSVAVEAM